MSDSELKEYQQQLELVEEGLTEDPEDEGLKELKAELLNLIQLLEGDGEGAVGNGNAPENTEIKKNTPEKTESPSSPKGGSLNEAPKRAGSVERSAERSVETTVNTVGQETNSDTYPNETSNPSNQTIKGHTSRRFTAGAAVLAQLIHGDRQFHPARVTAVSGSHDDPVYTVQFVKQAGTIETLRGHQIKALTPKDPPTGTGQKLALHQPPSKAKLLDQNKSSWQKFNQKSKANNLKSKKSIFATPVAPYDVEAKSRAKQKPNPRQRPRQRPVFERDEDGEREREMN